MYHLTKTDQAVFESALRRSVRFVYNTAEEKRKRENLIANGHREPSPRTDFNSNGE